MAWIYLFVAGMCEVLWAIGLKLYGFRLTTGSAVTVVLMLLSFWFLMLAMRTLPLGACYAIWTGIGAVGAASYGIIVLGEARSAAHLACLVMIVSGVIGLKLLTPLEPITPILPPDMQAPDSRGR